MLSAVLNSEIAIEVSIRIMNEFVAMRHFLANNAVLFERMNAVELKQLEYQKSTDEKFDKVFRYIENHAESEQKIFFDGQIYDAFRMEKHLNEGLKFDLPGIVLIDEIETHLHLEMQKNVLGFLENVFPNIQFIVTTHSPFVLSGTKNAVIYDLENHTLVKDGLTDLPYDGIVEGYFKADALSKELRDKFNRYQTLVKKQTLTDEEMEEISNLELYLDEIPDYLALEVTTEYRRLKDIRIAAIMKG